MNWQVGQLSGDQGRAVSTFLDLQSMLFSIPGAAERPLVGEFQCHHPAVLDGTVGRQAGKCRRGGLAWLGRYLGV